MLVVALLFGCPGSPEGGETHTRLPRHDSAADSADSGAADSGAADTDTGSPPDSDSGPPPGDTGSGGTGGKLGSSSGSVGTSTYTAYAPSCMQDGRAVPVLYTFHGTGGTGADMVDLWRPIADAECVLVVGLDSEDGMGWNFSGDVTNLSTLLDVVDAAWNINRRYMHGYSAGAHWTYVVGLANADYFAGIGVYAGSMQYAEAYGGWPTKEGPIPVAIAHGTDDTTVPYSEAEDAYATLTAAGWTANLDTYAGGTHTYEPGCEPVAWDFWQAHRL